MPRLIITRNARAGLRRCRSFLSEKSPQAAERAGQAIAQRLTSLETTPLIGRPTNRAPELRELVVGFGDSGYLVLYRHEPDDDAVYVLAIRHQKEAGY